jgi:hypothetical protein
MRDLDGHEIALVYGGSSLLDKAKSLVKKVTPVALAVSFVEGVIEGIKSELPEDDSKGK